MDMRTPLMAILLAALLAPVAFVQEGPDPFLMERVLPPGAILYLSIPQSPAASEGYLKSNLRAALEHPEVRPFIESFEAWWKRRKTEALPAANPQSPSWNDAIRNEIGLSIDEIWDLLGGPLAFAVYDVPLNEEHKLDLVLGLGSPDGGKLQKAASRFLEALKKNGDVLEGEFTHGGTKVRQITVHQTSFFYAVAGRTLVATTARERMEKILAAVADATVPGLRQDARFKDARARTAPDDRHLALAYLDVAGALRTFRKEIGDEGLKALDVLGVSDISSAAVSLAYDGPRLRERYALLTGPEARGIVKFLAGGTPVDAGAALVPAGALSYAHFGLSLAELYDVILAAGKISPEVDEAITKAVREYETRLGLGLREILGTVGTSWTTYSVLPEAGGAFPDSVGVVTLKDPAKFEAALAAVLADAKIPIEEMAFRGRKIRWVTIRTGPENDEMDLMGGMGGFPLNFMGLGFGIAFFTQEDRLFIATNPLALKRQILRLGRPGPSVLDDPRYKAMAALAPEGERESWSYTDFGRGFNLFYSSGEPFLHLLRDLARDPETGEPVVDLARLPLGETLADLIGPSFTSKRTVPGAILVDSWSNTAVGSTSGIAVGAIALAVAIPAVLIAERGGGGGAAENERVAQLTLVFIRQAQETFNNSDSDRNGAGDYWTRDVAGLHSLKDRSGQAIFLIDPDTAAADPEGAARYGLQAAPKNGYFFKALGTDPDGEPYAKEKDKDGNALTNKKRFGVAAWPAAYGATGRFTFVISEEGKVFRKDTQGKPPDGWPGKDPAENGWEKID
jgi:hypothetical protein